MNYFFLLVAFFYVVIGVLGCTAQKNVVKVMNDYVIFDGPVNFPNADKLVAILENGNIKTLYINSQGGSSEAGLKIGEVISKNNISVTVIGACHSACANYIFLPSKNRKAVADANIGLHGGYQSYDKQRLSLLEILPNDVKEIYKKSFPTQASNLEKEISLLKSANINPEIIEAPKFLPVVSYRKINISNL